jgi:hypothetical protein
LRYAGEEIPRNPTIYLIVFLHVEKRVISDIAEESNIRPADSLVKERDKDYSTLQQVLAIVRSSAASSTDL